MVECGASLRICKIIALSRRGGRFDARSRVSRRRHRAGSGSLEFRIGCFVQVLVRDNNVEQALRVLKKKMQREGLFREMKQRRAYEKPSEKRTRESAEAIRRARKLARKKAQYEGLLPKPKRKPPRAGQRPAAPAPMAANPSY